MLRCSKYKGFPLRLSNGCLAGEPPQAAPGPQRPIPSELRTGAMRRQRGLAARAGFTIGRQRESRRAQPEGSSVRPPTAAIDKHRLAGLQDGVYSIAITLLVLDLKLPPLDGPLSDALLWSALLGLWPKLLTWLLSFWVLVLFWIGDVRTLAALAVVDGFLLRLALWRLALVSLLPFSTALIGEHGNHVPAAALYAAHLTLLAATQTVRHRVVRAHPQLLASADAAADRGAQAYLTLACAAAAFGLAFVTPGYNMLALLPLLAVPLLRRFGSRRAGRDG